jgi:glucuronosyltransferase
MYKENAMKKSLPFRDQQQTPLDTAIIRTAYVIRHGGAPHLCSAAVALSWYQYLLIDVVAVLIVDYVASCLILYIFLKN